MESNKIIQDLRKLYPCESQQVDKQNIENELKSPKDEEQNVLSAAQRRRFRRKKTYKEKKFLNSALENTTSEEVSSPKNNLTKPKESISSFHEGNGTKSYFQEERLHPDTAYGNLSFKEKGPLQTQGYVEPQTSTDREVNRQDNEYFFLIEKDTYLPFDRQARQNIIKFDKLFPSNLDKALSLTLKGMDLKQHEKSKEDLKAEREAKKLIKHIARKKKAELESLTSGVRLPHPAPAPARSGGPTPGHSAPALTRSAPTSSRSAPTLIRSPGAFTPSLSHPAPAQPAPVHTAPAHPTPTHPTPTHLAKAKSPVSNPPSKCTNCPASAHPASVQTALSDTASNCSSNLPSHNLITSADTASIHIGPAQYPVPVHSSRPAHIALQSMNPDKSHSDIKTEREVKKLAKQLAKKKKTDTDIIAPTIIQADNLLKEVFVHPTTTEAPSPLTKKIVELGEKSKSEMRAERRAKQEAQRAAKVAEQHKVALKPNLAHPDKHKIEDSSQLQTSKSLSAVKVTSKKPLTPEKWKKSIPTRHTVKLFNHLYADKKETTSVFFDVPLNSKEIHPAMVRLGVQYASRIIMGSNARCIALLNALKKVVQDYTLPRNVEFSRGLEAYLAPNLDFLTKCRPPAVSMTNALKHIKWQLTQLPNSIGENDAKIKLHEAIDTYKREQIEMARRAISIVVCEKISKGDVILTYGCSSLIEHILKEAKESKTFRVVVVTAQPWKEGREMLRRLTAHGIHCSSVTISALSFIMREISVVLLGAGALLANGYVMARVGTAQVAMVAHAHNVPVLVCCETHKFSERVQTDSFVYNEIGDPDELAANSRAAGLSLVYDVTPPDLVTAVVTELAILPCTSVPVILRIKPSEFGL